jgi:hypothetical protein
MRNWVGFALLIAVAAPATAGLVPLPDGAQKLVLPGFEVASPGSSWFAETSFPHETRDGSSSGAFRMRLYQAPGMNTPVLSMLGLGKTSTAVIDIAGAVVPIASNDPKAITALLLAYMKKGAETEAADHARQTYLKSEFSEATVNGAACVRWEAISEDRGVPGHEGEAYTLALHRLVCSDPEFPGYTARVDYSLRLEPGEKRFNPDAAGLAVVNSIAFRKLGYHARLIPVGSQPLALADANGTLWVTYGGKDGRIVPIDPKSNAAGTPIPVGENPRDIVAAGPILWVSLRGGKALAEVDAVRRVVLRTIPLPSGPGTLASGFGALWVTLTEKHTVLRIDPVSGSTIEIANVGQSPFAITCNSEAVFVTDYASDKVYRIDPVANTVTGSQRGGESASFIIADGPWLWVDSQSDEPAVLRLDPARPGADPVRYKGIDYRPRGLAAWQGKIWVANGAGASVSPLDPNRPDAPVVFDVVGEQPWSLLFAQGSLWVSLPALDAIVRMEPD